MNGEEAAFEAWLDRARKELVPMIEGSAVGVSLVPDGETDAKFAIELGFLIMMNKPIIAIVRPGTVLSPKLVAVADKVLYIGDLSTPGADHQIRAAITDLVGDDDDEG